MAQFKQRYLTVKLAPSKLGLSLHADCLEDVTCLCTDGCTNCSGDCTGCSETCKGENSLGALIPDPEGLVEMVMSLEALRAIVLKNEKLEAKAR